METGRCGSSKKEGELPEPLFKNTTLFLILRKEFLPFHHTVQPLAVCWTIKPHPT